MRGSKEGEVRRAGGSGIVWCEAGCGQVSTTDLGLGHCYSWYSANPPFSDYDGYGWAAEVGES